MGGGPIQILKLPVVTTLITTLAIVGQGGHIFNVNNLNVKLRMLINTIIITRFLAKFNGLIFEIEVII